MSPAEYTVSQLPLRDLDMRKIMSLDAGKRVDIYRAYHSAALFNSREVNVASGLGIPALSMVEAAHIPLSVVVPRLGNLVYEGLTYLALDNDRWRFVGSAKAEAGFRSWLSDGQVGVRARRVKELLGISERAAHRFLLMSHDLEVTVTNDVEDIFGAAQRRFTMVLDAWAFANELKARFGGTFFTAEARGAK